MSQADVPAVDADGNTLFHEVVLDLSHGMEELERISKLGVDINQANNLGRIPLHALCGKGWYDAILSKQLVKHTRWILERTTNPDVADAEGIRPLHLASMMSEYFVKELLASGADPAGATHEGLTPLHLAARARESNVVGMLISDLTKSRDTEGQIAKGVQHLNAKDKSGRSPLHYACRSGRHETVALLLDAGANFEAVDHDGKTLLDACAEFEDEEKLWAEGWKPAYTDWDNLWKTAISKDWDHVAVGGYRIHDELRPWVLPGKAAIVAFQKTYDGPWTEAYTGIRSPHDTTRLEEILQLLFESALKREGRIKSMAATVDRCIERCETDGHAYTLRCLKHLKTKLEAATKPEATIQQLVINDDSNNLHEKDQSLLQSVGSDYFREHDYIETQAVDQLLRMQEWDVIERLLRRGSCSTEFKTLETGRILRLLVKHGYASLLATIFCSDDPPFAAVSDLDGTVDPLIFEACQRALPNMDVIRVLVEKVHVDVNAKSRTAEKRMADLEEELREEVDPDYDYLQGRNTTLHDLALGRHWWAVVQGIPYLVASGAELEQLNEEGNTPQQYGKALCHIGTFGTEAEEALKKF
jgi:hypothetical protein